MTKEEAIKRIKDWNLDNDKMEVLSVIIPELKESEDEKMLTQLHSWMKEFGGAEEYTEKVYCWLKGLLEKQGEQNNDKIIERARTEKQRVLLTETNGDAHIDWDCRSLRDVKSLLEYGLEYIDAQLEKQGEKNESKKIEPWTAWSEEDENHLLNCINYFTGITEFSPFYKDFLWIKSLKERVQPQPKQELSVDAATNEYIDLGLPSGTFWKLINEKGYYTFDEAVEKFMYNLPTKEQWEELKEKCKWVWKDIGYEVTGPNGNTIYLPANGYRYGNGTGLLNVGTYGYYWSSTYYNEAGAYYMGFRDPVGGVNNSPRFCGLSVRLVK